MKVGDVQDGRHDATPEEIPWVCVVCSRERATKERYIISSAVVCGLCWSNYQASLAPKKEEKTMPTPEWLEQERAARAAEGDFMSAHALAVEQHLAFRQEIQTLEAKVEELELQEGRDEDLAAEVARLGEILTKVRDAVNEGKT